MSDVLQSLGQVSELWLDSKNPFRNETIQALQVSTGFSRRQIEIALANCFEELTLPKINAYIRDWDQVPISNVDVLHILPSNVFTAWVHGAVITLLCGHRCVLKPSSREPVFAGAWKKSLELVDPTLAAHVDVIAWDEKRAGGFPVVVAYGSDETLRKIQYQLPPAVRFVGYGHKLSVGVIFKEALKENFADDLLEHIRRDVEPFRLQGCLSPQILYVEDQEFTRWPGLQAVVDVAPKIKPFREWSDVVNELDKFYPYLSCVGYGGGEERQTFLESTLGSHPAVRVCLFGEMQRPPLSWRNGGIDLSDLLNSTL